MAFYRVQFGFPYDSALPRDVITMNPHFSGTDPDQLATALVNNLNTYAPTAGKPYTLKVYDATKLPPSFPLVTRTNPGTTPNTGLPREIALCLSYYTTYNRPRYRGRLYIPGAWITSTPGLRPTSTQMQVPINFAKEVLSKALPSATNWIVWSTTERTGKGGVTDVWVDDEWDTVRKRGLKGTTRTKATIP